MKPNEAQEYYKAHKRPATDEEIGMIRTKNPVLGRVYQHHSGPIYLDTNTSEIWAPDNKTWSRAPLWINEAMLQGNLVLLMEYPASNTIEYLEQGLHLLSANDKDFRGNPLRGKEGCYE